ncbi:L-proline trans-4-hydroxylase-like [Gigantopelta aegis]|uniref:L-proline trans-4-hydroxylase-like n=1 Tax=Gigantopelta aegis TaxID=1735272 RepID=UPI001B88A77F|nr:L-proline trans-4-hydroxylase-like [Gigantopelta aegis]
MDDKEFVYSANYKPLDSMKTAFDKYGYIIIRGLLQPAELQKVTQALEENSEIHKHAFGLSDGEDKISRQCIWSLPGNDITGMVARSTRVVRTVEKLLSGDVAHYHSKLIMKEAKTGGKFVWHQDYGYWYKNGFVKPDMLSVLIAIDPCLKDNGCLEVLVGSHKCGRVDHMMVGGQTGADLERVELIKLKCPLIYVELDPGDAVFFHSNVLHTSSANTSDKRRWVLISAFNLLSNNSLIQHHHPTGTRVHVVDDSAILSCTNFTDMTGKRFQEPTKNRGIIPVRE